MKTWKKRNNNQNKNLCHSSHRDHIDSICPISKRAFEKPKDWSEEFDILRMAQNKRFEENKRKAQVIQKKLLALAGNHQADAVEDPQLEKSGTRKERESRPSSGGNAAEGKMIDLATSEEETEASIQDANLVASSPGESEEYRTQYRPGCSENPKEPFKGVVERKLEDSKTKGETNRATLPSRNPVKVTEIDLVSDTEEEKENPSAKVGHKGGAPQLAQNGITIEVKLQDGTNISSTTKSVTSEATRKSLPSSK